jgi:hypothetical protein
VSQRFAQLVVFTTDPDEFSSLRLLFSSTKNVIVAQGSGPEVSKRENLDALWLTPMQASSYGISSPAPFGRAVIHHMPSDKVAKGLPHLMIVGVALDPLRDYSDDYRARVPAEALAKAIMQYNEGHLHQPLLRVGSLPENLCLAPYSRLKARQAIISAFHNLSVEQENAQVLHLRQQA